MKRYTQGQEAPIGLYIAARALDMRLVESGESILRGKPGAQYIHLPLVVAVALGPVIGGLFAVALPLMVFAAIGQAVVQRIRKPRVVEAGTPARRGVYVAVNRLSVRHVGADGEPIDAVAGTRFLRVPTVALVLFSPLVGGAFVVFFPLLFAAALVYAVSRAIAAPFVALWERHVYLTHARWEPAAAYVVDPNESDDEGTEPVLDAALESIGAEVEARRAAERGEG